MPVVVAINRRLSDTPAEIALITAHVEKLGVPVALCDVWAKGGEGGEALAKVVQELLDGGTAKFKPIYETALPIKAKIETIVAQGVWCRWRGLYPGSEPGHRLSRVDRHGRHARVHGQDAVLAH